MCIVDMHSDLIGQIIKCMVIFQMLIQNRLQRTRHQQILLAQAQALAVDVVVCRIENLRNGLGHGILLERADIIAA